MPRPYTVAQARLRAINQPRAHYLTARLHWDNRLRFQPAAYTLTWKLRRLGEIRKELEQREQQAQYPPDVWDGVAWEVNRALTQTLAAERDAIRQTLR